MKIKIKTLLTPFNLILAVILLAALFLRVYRIDTLLGFYYDQGRDALVIWDLLNKGKFFLIGPVTGIEGIFRGPLYYYLIAPFYLLGKGSPVWPSVFLALTTVVSLWLIYHLGLKIQGKATGITAVLLGGFSYRLVMASRWLSNPTPMFLLSMILVWMMFLVMEKKRWAWIVISFVAGASLFHFGSAGEFFYFPALFIFALWQRKILPKRREITFSIIAFASTFLPLLLFDIKHAGILSGNIKKFLLEERSFAPPTWRFVLDKMEFYYSVVSNKIFYGVYEKETIILSLIALAFVYYLSVLLKNDRVKVLLLLLASPFLGLIFFQGNFGNIYDYYLTGYYLIFILLLAVTLGQLWKFFLGKVFVVYFLYFFLSNNLLPLYATLTDRAEDDRSVAFVNQKKAIEWIYQDAKDKSFNVDVYVPPVIPHAYDYLFKWYGEAKYARQPVETQVPLLYTLYEVDPSHPERLDAWLKRQAGIGKAEQGASFGGITVQRRTRR